MAQLNVRERNVNDVTIADLAGKIMIGEGEVQLRETVRHLLQAGKKNILLNLGDVSFMDSSGVGELVHSYTTTTNQGGKLKLMNLPMKIRDLLTITGLINVFDAYDSEDEAVRSFN
ncbi:STAS domain-containing protein [Pendulispora rubella]|uniref:Anti-sigma factor antagonist n=1 Tax=Pendulispora rubella TaxID=2741070 RepID=A0ABZ2LC09_9BACT